MFEVVSSDYDEDNNKAWAEIMLELNIGYELEGELKAYIEDGVKKDAIFQNFELEWMDDGLIRIHFQLEQDL